MLDEIDRFLAALAARRSLSAAQANTLFSLQSRNEVLRELHETLGDLHAALHNPAGDVPGWLVSSLREGLGALLLIAQDAALARRRDDVDLLAEMTLDRGVLVEKLRSQVMAGRADSHKGDLRSIYIVTALYERTVWLLQRYARLLSTLIRPTVRKEAANEIQRDTTYPSATSSANAAGARSAGSP